MPGISVTICSNNGLETDSLLEQTLNQSNLYNAIELKEKNQKFPKKISVFLLSPTWNFMN